MSQEFEMEISAKLDEIISLLKIISTQQVATKMAEVVATEPLEETMKKITERFKSANLEGLFAKLQDAKSQLQNLDQKLETIKQPPTEEGNQNG